MPSIGRSDTLAPSSPTHSGPYVLNNHILLESIIQELPEFADIISLLQVSREVSSHVQSVFARSARHVSFKGFARLSSNRIVDIFHRPLQSEPQEPYRRLLDDGRVILVGGGPAGTPYINSWRHLRELDFSGTLINSNCAKVFIAACAGGKVSSFNGELGMFSKDFGTGVPPGAARILRDQGLRLTRLSVTDCKNVDIHEINVFLRKMLTSATATKRDQLKRHAQGNNNANNPNANAQNNLQAQHALHHALAHGPAHPGPAPPLGAHLQGLAHPNGAAHPNGNPAVPDALVSFGMMEDEIISIPSPLPGCVDDLDEWGLPCLSLRRLEVANVEGLYVFPPGKYRGKKEWNYRQECPFARNVAHLNVVAGCLGIDVDVIFCQGSGCTGDYGSGKQRVQGVLEDHRTAYKNPLPRLPGERILITDDERVFRIPKHCIQDTVAPPLPTLHNQNAFAALPPLPTGLAGFAGHAAGGLHPFAGLGHPGQFPGAFYGHTANPFATNIALQGAAQAAGAAQMQFNHQTGPPVAGPWIPPPGSIALPPLQPNPPAATFQGVFTPAASNFDLFIDDDTSDDDVAGTGPSTANQPLASTHPPPQTNPLLQQQNPFVLPYFMHQAQPHPQHAQPAPGIGLSLSLRRSMHSSAEEGERQPTMIRSIAMIDGPRGLCEGCNKEVWLCEKCNSFWNVCCGGCAGQTGGGSST